MSAQDKAESIEWRRLISGDPCFYCGTAEAPAYEDDHYISVANGGTDHWWNLVRACQGCNRRKAAMNGDEFLELMGCAVT
jgi:5-methylcytosine-specific restriction endonuclease McrA